LFKSNDLRGFEFDLLFCFRLDSPEMMVYNMFILSEYFVCVLRVGGIISHNPLLRETFQTIFVLFPFGKLKEGYAQEIPGIFIPFDNRGPLSRTGSGRRIGPL
jgi:hypothetical protein